RTPNRCVRRLRVMRISTDRYSDQDTHRVHPPGEFPGPQPFAQLRSLKCAILEELRVGWEAGYSMSAEGLPEGRPGPTETDGDVASLLFEEYWQRHQQGERTESEQDEQSSQQGVQGHLVGPVKPTNALLLSLPSVGDELFSYRLCRELGQGSFAKVF